LKNEVGGFNIKIGHHFSEEALASLEKESMEEE
jgi:hypothetical protein